jgi:hypothetical protein
MTAQHADGPHDDDADGCLCDIEIDTAETIADADLPPPSGGVRWAAVSPGDDDQDVCGFAVTDPTSDENLPAAAGGFPDIAFALRWLAEVLEDAGLKVAEQPGWRTRGRGDVGPTKGVICHHTAGPETGIMPSLGVVIRAALHVDADGIFGPGTEAALRKFQSAKGLVPDGIAGPRTWTALDAA